MDLTNVLLEDSMRIPISYDSKNGFTAGVLKIIDAYINSLTSYGIDNATITSICHFKSYLERMYDSYFLGHQQKSYEYFLNSIKSLSEDISKFYTDFTETNFYRARYNTGNKDYDNKEMFHIPLNSRGIIKTQRYSFPGLPCLYLGASSYACWLELNRPSINDFQIALIKMDSNDDALKIMDLSLLPEIQKNKLDLNESTISFEQYLLLWPIIAMCSLKVCNEDDDFKPEYIFPQFILELILTDYSANNQIIGIKYASTKVSNISEEQYKDDWTTYTNYVFPVHTNSVSTSNECPILSKYFKIISNYSGKELQVITDILREPQIKFDFQDNSSECNIKLYTTDNLCLPYKKSIFYRIERALLVKDFSSIDDEIKIQSVTQEEIENLFKTEKLSDLSIEMLKAAANSVSGQLMKYYTLEGLTICVESKDFTIDKTPRNIAKVEESFNELLQYSYITSLGSKGEIYTVTTKGFEYIDSI